MIELEIGISSEEKKQMKNDGTQDLFFDMTRTAG